MHIPGFTRQDTRRFIVHIDMDAFFASVEERDNPFLQGKPVIVGADPKKGKGRGVVSTCSYQARRFGVHSAMPISLAYQKCPNAVFLPVDMPKYARVSGKIFKILYDFTPDIEPVSIDEAFLDITASYQIFTTPLETCLTLKSRIKKEIGLTCSCGLAPTKMAAKIASELKKPDGMVEVTPEGLLDFLWPLEVTKLWGVAKAGETLLNKYGIKKIGDLARLALPEVIRLFGKNGAHLWQLSNGIDPREVEGVREAKSISNETTFAVDTDDKEKILSTLAWLSEKVCSRLREENLSCATITLKIRLQGFDTFSRSKTITTKTSSFEPFYREIKKMYADFPQGQKRIRLVGVKASNLACTQEEESLFTDTVELKRKAINKTLDKINEKFGEQAIAHAATKLV